MNKIKLPNITLCCIGSEKYRYQQQKALDYSSKDIEFGAIKNIIVPTNSIDEWNKAVVFDLGDYIGTDFALLIHPDGFVVNPDKWNDDFLKYDFIGAPFPLPKDSFSYRDINGTIQRVGNSVSIRSKKLLDLPKKIGMEWKPFHGFYNEDGYITVNTRHIFEQHGCKFAPLELAAQFSHETPIPETKGIIPFAFHKNKGGNKKYPNFEKTVKTNVKIITKIKKILKKIFPFLKKEYGLNKYYLKKLLNTENPTILEIGSADGSDTLEFLKIFKGKNTTVYGFEPEPKNIEILKNKIKDPRFKLFEAALSDVNGELSFNRSSSENPNDLSLSGSIMKPKNHLKIWNDIHFNETIRVKSITLDSFYKKNNLSIIDFIWCDVQGAEKKVILGGLNTFKHKVRFFYTEYSDNEIYEDQPTLKEIMELLPSFEIIKDFGTDVLLKNKI